MNTVKLEIVIKSDFNITNAEYQMIRMLGDVGQSTRIEMIKFIRLQYEVNLRTAKNVVDAVLERDRANKMEAETECCAYVKGTTTLGDLLRSKMG